MTRFTHTVCIHTPKCNDYGREKDWEEIIDDNWKVATFLQKDPPGLEGCGENYYSIGIFCRQCNVEVRETSLDNNPVSGMEVPGASPHMVSQECPKCGKSRVTTSCG